MNEALAGALWMAEHGFKVFPLWGVIERDGVFYDQETGAYASKEDGSGKRPRGYWKEQATNDAEAIQSWFDESPDYNYGVMLGDGLLVVDCDTEDALNKFEFAFLQIEEIECETFCVKTARGFHFYFKGESYTFKLATDTDLKASGGYVVGPGSLSWAGTRYTIYDEAQTVWQAPEWICKRTRERPAASGTGQPLRIAEGDRNNAMAKVAGALLRQGFAHDDVESIILDVVNPKYTESPLDPHELERTVFKSMREWPIGSDLSAQIDLTNFRAVLEDKTPDEVTDKRFFAMHTDIAQWNEPEWLIPGHLQAEGLLQLHAPSYTGKTFFAIDLAMSIMNHTKWLGQEITHKTYQESSGEKVAKDYVLYILSEGAFDFRQRLDAWIEIRGEGNYEKLITIVEEPLDLSNPEDWTKIGQEILNDERVNRVKNKIGLVVIDTQSMLIQADENANNEMSHVAVTLRKVAKALKSAILLVHHEGHEGQQNTRIGGRGASAFGAAMDVTMKLGVAGRGLVMLEFVKVKGAQLPHEKGHGYLGEFQQTESSAAISGKTQETLQEMAAAGADNVHAAEVFLLQQPEQTATQSALAEGLGVRYNSATWKELAKAMADLTRFEKRPTHHGAGFTWTFVDPENGDI